MSDASTEDDAIAMIRESTAGIADRDDLTRIRELRYGLPGFSRETWRAMCDMGWPGLCVPEERGGVGLGLSAYCALAEELGAALVPEPLIGAVLAASQLEGEDLAGLLSGTRLVLAAWQDEPDAAGPSIGPTLEDGRLHGRKLAVPMAAGADAFLVMGPSDSWLVEAGQDGTRLETKETQDGGHYGALVLEGAVGRRVGANRRPALAQASLATSAYLLGMMEAALARTVAYLGMRTQFGRLIGSFQALQHRAVDLRLQIVLTRASVEDAAARWDREADAPDSRAAIHRAKLRASSAAMLVMRQAIQLHGGIGFTDEHDIGLYLRKAMVLVPQFGSARLQKAEYASLLPVEQDS